MSKTGHTPYGEVPLDAEVGMDAPRARGQRQRATPEQRAPPEPNPPSEPAPPDANEAVRRAQRRFREVKQAGVAVHQLLPSPIAEESASAGKGARERGLDTKEQEIASKYMRGVPAFTQLSLNGLQQVVQKLRVVKFAPKEVIINKGDTGKEFFMIKDGCVEFTKGLSEGADDLLGKRTEGEFFGEIALIADDNRATANATASGRGAECFALNKRHFDLLLKRSLRDERQKKTGRFRYGEIDFEETGNRVPYLIIPNTDVRMRPAPPPS